VKGSIMGFFGFLSSRTGRLIRMLLGTLMIGLGAGLAGGLNGAWWVLAVLGLVPLTAAVFDVCLFAPLAHLPVGGRAMRRKLLAH
jgi:uncharacterized membrane protein YedE/YeeE